MMEALPGLFRALASGGKLVSDKKPDNGVFIPIGVVRITIYFIFFSLIQH